MALTLGAPLACLLLLMPQAAETPAATPRPAPRRPAAPLQATFDMVTGGKLAAGRNVDFPAILMAPTAIQTTSKGQVRYFVLAVKKDSAYFRGLAELAKELREVALVKAQGLGALIRDDAGYRVQMKEVDAVIEKAIGVKAARLAQVPPEEAVAVEVLGMEGLGSAYNWETVVDTSSPLRAPSLSRSPVAFPLPPSLQTSWSESGMRRDLLNAALGRPPDISKKLPEFPASPKLTSDRELESYNAAVELFNAELERRRVFAVQRTEEDVRFFLERIELFLAKEEQTLSATIVAKNDLAATTYTQIHGRSPAAYVKERATGDAAFVRRSFRTASVFLTSFPGGATVTLDGRELGATPLLAKDLPVGSKPTLVLSRAGFHPIKVEETVTPQPSSARRLDLSLDPEGLGPVRLITNDEAGRLFASAYTPPKRFSLAVFASSERLGFKGKKDKDAAKRADALRKAAAAHTGPAYAGWFDLSVNPDMAEVVLEIAALEPGAIQDPKIFRVFRITYRGAQDEDTVSETLSLSEDKASVDRLLCRITEQLKQRRFERALGVEG